MPVRSEGKRMEDGEEWLAWLLNGTERAAGERDGAAALSAQSDCVASVGRVCELTVCFCSLCESAPAHLLSVRSSAAPSFAQLSMAAAVELPSDLLDSGISLYRHADAPALPMQTLAITLLAWILLAVFVNPLYCTGANAVWFVWQRLRRAPRQRDSALLTGAYEQPWGTRLLLAYATLTPSKQAYWRRLLRSFVYYLGATLTGFFYLLTHFREPRDMYRVYTPGMEWAFCAAATHFLLCCAEDWPCRAHMGRTRREQLVVFWGRLHLQTANTARRALCTPALTWLHAAVTAARVRLHRPSHHHRGCLPLSCAHASAGQHVPHGPHVSWT